MTELPKPTILLIDDDQKYAEEVETALGVKYQITIASTAEDGISKIKITDFDLVLLDIYLGTGGQPDGFDLVNVIRNVQPDIPIIAITKDASRDITYNALKDFNVDIIVKHQLDFESWVEKIDSLIRLYPHRKVFISYAREDKEDVFFLARLIRKNRIKVFIDTGNILPGADIDEEIVHMINRCNVFLLMISKTSIRSSYVNKEVSFASRKDKKIVPVMLEELRRGLLPEVWQLNGIDQKRFIDFSTFLQKLENEFRSAIFG